MIKNIKNCFIEIIKITTALILIIFYLSGFVFIPVKFSVIIESKQYTYIFMYVYLLLGLITFYYINGILRRKTKNLKQIFLLDFISFKKELGELIQDVKNLFSITFNLLFGLVIFFLIIITTLIVIIFGIWIIIILGPLWIIAIILTLILFSIISKR